MHGPVDVQEDGMRHGGSRSGFCFFGCFAVVVLVILALAGIGYWVYWYTELPLKYFSSIVNHVPKVHMTGVSGSLAQGVQVGRLEIRHSDGAVSSLEGVGYDQDSVTEMSESHRLTLRNAYAKHAHLFLNLSSQGRGHHAKTNAQTPVSKNAEATGDASVNDYRVSVDKVRMSDVTIEDPRSLLKFVLESFHVDRLELDKDGFRMEKLELATSLLSLRAAKVGKQLEMSGVLKTGGPLNLTKEVSFTGQANFTDLAHASATLRAFGDALQIDAAPLNLTAHVVARRLSLRDHATWGNQFDDVDCDLTVSLVEGAKLRVELKSGGFTICGHPFNFSPGSVDIDAVRAPQATFSASGAVAGKTILVDYEFAFSKDRPLPENWLTRKFSASPPMPAQEVQALLCKD
jgi:hypothetical protein